MPSTTPARPLDRVVLAAALLFPLLYAATALARLSYPFELEWMEGGVLAGVQRLLHGQPLYAAPSLDYIPFDYTPLYLWVAALPARLLGESFAALRLTSFAASLGVFALLASIVRREGGSAAAAFLAVGLFAATYRLAGAWLDVARPDTLFLLLVLAALRAYRMRDPARGGALAGALFALAFLAKQTALLIALPVVLHALIAERRRFAALAGAMLALIGGSTLLLDRASGGWYRYYVFGVALGHRVDPSLLLRFWIGDLARPLAIAAVIGAAALVRPAPGAATGTRGFLAAAAAGLLGSAWWLRMFRGSYDNALLPACAGVALLFGLGGDALRARLAAAAPARARGALEAALALAALAQLALLAWNPLAQIPTAADRAAGERLIENLRQAPGPVLVPSHPYLAARAGMPATFPAAALDDAIGHRHGPVGRALAADLERALREHRWAAVVLDNRDWLWDDASPYYQAAWPALGAGDGLWTRTGMLTRPDSVLVPRR